MSQSILIQKTLKFSSKIIKLQQYLSKEKKRKRDFKANNKKCNKYWC